jgi:DNA transformation protein
MAVSEEYLDYVIEQLGDVGPVRARRMFGGAGVYGGDVMFAIVADDVLYLKVDESNRGEYEEAGMGPFVPFPEKANPMTMSYYEVPASVLESRKELGEWAAKALRVAQRQNAKKGKKK